RPRTAITSWSGRPPVPPRAERAARREGGSDEGGVPGRPHRRRAAPRFRRRDASARRVPPSGPRAHGLAPARAAPGPGRAGPLQRRPAPPGRGRGPARPLPRDDHVGLRAARQRTPRRARDRGLAALRGPEPGPPGLEALRPGDALLPGGDALVRARARDVRAARPPYSLSRTNSSKVVTPS